ncbi:hypothetical protein M758_5G112200, partial [Ceratodon purpureus]
RTWGHNSASSKRYQQDCLNSERAREDPCQSSRPCIHLPPQPIPSRSVTISSGSLSRTEPGGLSSGACHRPYMIPFSNSDGSPKFCNRHLVHKLTAKSRIKQSRMLLAHQTLSLWQYIRLCLRNPNDAPTKAQVKSHLRFRTIRAHSPSEI